MNVKISFGVLPVVLQLACILTAQPRRVDVQRSGMTVRVFKAGALSALGHDHEIAALIADGAIDTAARRVELRVNAAALRVRDPNASDKDRQEIQKTMLGPDVLAVDRYPQIVFQSTAAKPAAPGSWNVSGELKLHGQTRLVTVQAHLRDGHYVGTVRLKQSDFGMKPVKVAGGMVSVKDEVRIDFDIQLAQE